MNEVSNAPTDNNEPLIVKFTHYYSCLKDTFYGVQVPLSYDDLQLACAYLQLLRDEFPSTQIVDDVLGESEAVYLMERLYGAQRIDERLPHETDVVLDFHENWETIASCISPEEYVTKFSEIARPRARLVMANMLLKDARQLIRKHGATDRELELLKQLEHVASGGYVPREWGLVTIDGSSYAGRVVASEMPDLPESG